MGDRKPYTFRIDEDLVKELKHVAIDLGVPYNVLIEEGIKYVIEKYKRETKNDEDDKA